MVSEVEVNNGIRERLTISGRIWGFVVGRRCTSRKMNSLIRFFLILLILEVLELTVAVNQTTHARSYEQILSRKRRFLVFPPGSAIVVCLIWGGLEEILCLMDFLAGDDVIHQDTCAALAFGHQHDWRGGHFLPAANEGI